MEIKIQNLIKKFGEKTAVNIPEFTIRTGEIIGLVGNNGAGKTTLFRLMLDLLKADHGTVLFTFDAGDAINPAESEEWKQFTGAYVDEGFLIDFLTPEEYFEFIGKANGISFETLEERLEKLKPLMNNEILGQKKFIRDFSAGNKQKIGIIGALINHPQLLILDEPFNFLDPSSQNFLKHTLSDYNQQTGATILVSSHNLHYTIDISSRIALLEKGQLIKDLPNNSGSATKELEDYFNI